MAVDADQKSHQIRDDNHIITRRKQEIQMESPSQGRNGNQRVRSWSSPHSKSTSFNGVKSSFMEWSEEVVAYMHSWRSLTFKSACHYSRPQPRQRTSFRQMWCSWVSCQILTITSRKKEADEAKAQTENKDDEVKRLTHLKVWRDQQWKISDTVKITLALQNVRANLAQSLNVSVSKSPEKGKGWKGSSSSFQPQKGKSKGKGRPSQKEKVSGPLGHGIRLKIRIRIKVTKRVNRQKWKGKRCTVRYVGNQVINLINAGGTVWTISSSNELRLNSHLRTQGKFKISRSILRINPFRLYSHINFEDFKIYDPLFNLKHSPQSQVSSHYGSVSSVLSHPGQVSIWVVERSRFLGQKMVTYITHKVVMNIMFLVVESVVNPIIGLDVLHQAKVQLKENLTHWLTCHSSHGALCVRQTASSQRSAALSQIKAEGLERHST